MFGFSLEHLLILLITALFILGPERLPETTRWLTQSIRKIRGFASGAQEQLRSELGPEFQELRKPLQDLQALRTFSPKTALTHYLLEGPANPDPSASATPATPAVTPLRAGERAPVDPDAT